MSKCTTTKRNPFLSPSPVIKEKVTHNSTSTRPWLRRAPFHYAHSRWTRPSNRWNLLGASHSRELSAPRQGDWGGHKLLSNTTLMGERVWATSFWEWEKRGFECIHECGLRRMAAVSVPALVIHKVNLLVFSRYLASIPWMIKKQPISTMSICIICIVSDSKETLCFSSFGLLALNPKPPYAHGIWEEYNSEYNPVGCRMYSTYRRVSYWYLHWSANIANVTSRRFFDTTSSMVNK